MNNTNENKTNDIKIMPEQTLTNHIINATAEMIIAESRVLRHKRLNNNIPSNNHVVDFSISIIVVWNYIKYMINDRKLYSIDNNDKTNDYKFLDELEFDKMGTPDLHRLIRAKSYIIFCLHTLGLMNITNKNSINTKLSDVR